MQLSTYLKPTVLTDKYGRGGTGVLEQKFENVGNPMPQKVLLRRIIERRRLRSDIVTDEFVAGDFNVD